MKTLNILVLFLCYIVGIQPETNLCPTESPFRLNDRSCENFSSICFNTDKQQCNQLLNACKQCPPSNITLIMLRDILEISIYQSNFTTDKIVKMIDKLTTIQDIMANKFNDQSNFTTDKIVKMIDKLTTIQEIMANKFNVGHISIIILLIIILIFIFENRFKYLTKCIQIFKNKKSHYHLLLQSRKANNLKELNNNTSEELAGIKKNVENLSQMLSDHIYYMQNQPSDTGKTIKFSLEGNGHKFEKLYVHNNENIVQVKQHLCAKLSNVTHDYYKRMQLKDNERLLNNNDYLLKQIDSFTNSINYITDDTIDTSEIIVVKLKGKMRLPEMIQIQKNESFENVLSIISSLIGTKDFRVYKRCIENNKMLEISMNNINGNNNETVNGFHLIDGDFLNVVTIEDGELTLRSIFNEIDLFTVKYQNIDRISTFLNDKNMKDFILFYCNDIINENEFIFQYDVSSDSQLKFCQFKEFQDIIKNDSIYSGFNWEIYFARHKNEKILIKKYDIKLDNLKNEEWVLKELKTFLITKSHRRFIQLNNVYVDNKSFYISMENMPGGTLTYFLKKNPEFDWVQVIKWAAQILEGLDFLHQKKIVHRDLNSSNILVGDNKDLKLSNFNLSKYNENGVPCSIMEKFENLSYIKVRYMAPEILDSREYGFQCDVWSFGAVLVRIVTGKKPYPKMTKKEALQEIIKSEKIKYDLPNKFDSKIKLFIDSCFGKNPSSRRTINDLVKDEMIKNSLR